MEMSLVSCSGVYDSSCGYCDNKYGNSCSHRFGMSALRLTPMDYQALIDRGWRRSGTFLYFPHNDKSCCPQYTIRLDASLHVRVLPAAPSLLSSSAAAPAAATKGLSKSHAKVLKRMERYLQGRWEPSKSEREQAGDDDDGNDDDDDDDNDDDDKNNGDKSNKSNSDSKKIVAERSEKENENKEPIIVDEERQVTGSDAEITSTFQIIRQINENFTASLATCVAPDFVVRSEAWSSTLATVLADFSDHSGGKQVPSVKGESHSPGANIFASFRGAVQPSQYFQQQLHRIASEFQKQEVEAQEDPSSAQEVDEKHKKKAEARSAKGDNVSDEKNANAAVHHRESTSHANKKQLSGKQQAQTQPKKAAKIKENDKFGFGSLAQSNIACVLFGKLRSLKAFSETAAANPSKIASHLVKHYKDQTISAPISIKNTQNGASVVAVEAQACDNGCIYFFVPSFFEDAVAELGPFFAIQASRSRPKPKHDHDAAVYPPKKLTISLKRAMFSEEAFNLYRKYQVAVHKDNFDEVNSNGFKRFLVSNPFTSPDIFGAYHYEFRIDGRLIAVAVVDFLPSCLSSVYLFYDPEFRFLSLGTYTALREIDIVQRIIANKQIPSEFDDMTITKSVSPKKTNDLDQLRFYYMGYYIHHCPKMRYKAQFHPSFLLCPQTRRHWVPFNDCVAAMNRRKEGPDGGIIPFFAGPQAATKNAKSSIQDIRLSLSRQVLTVKDLTEKGLGLTGEFKEVLENFKEDVMDLYLTLIVLID